MKGEVKRRDPLLYTHPLYVAESEVFASRDGMDWYYVTSQVVE
jgi:hypothetical protein